MSDEQEQRRDPAGRAPQPDETRSFSPIADDDDATKVSQNHPDEGPRSGDAWVFDRPENPGGTSPTERVPRADDPTAVTPRASRPDATSIMPPVGSDASWGAAEAPWSGRAEVRPPRPGEYTPADWATEPPSEPRGKWWMPIVIGIVGLVLLALLGWGLWLIARAQGASNNAPALTTTGPAPAATNKPTTTATSAAPTTEQATTAPTPSEVTIPALRGRSQEEAREALSRRGLSSRLRFVSSTDAPPGTVIDSDPAEGQEVPPGTVVTLVIAAEPTTSPSPSSTSATP
jgi:PASTA domain-containing protein